MIVNQQFLPYQPSFMDAKFKKNTFEDDNEWDIASKMDRIATWGADGKTYYNQFEMGVVESSAWVKYPEKYRFIGL